MTRKRQYELYRTSLHWLKLRQAVLERDGYQCKGCGCGERLEAHHVFYREKFEDSVAEDLITLCRDCHKKHHGFKVKPRPEPEPVHNGNKQRRGWCKRGRGRRNLKHLGKFSGNFLKRGARMIYCPPT